MLKLKKLLVLLCGASLVFANLAAYANIPTFEAASIAAKPPQGQKILGPRSRLENRFLSACRIKEKCLARVELSSGPRVYMQARYYDPKIGRFLSPDPVTFSSDKPEFFNRYWYADGNPYKNIDPDGQKVHLAGNETDRKTLIKQMEEFTGMSITRDDSGMLHSGQCLANYPAASPIASDALFNAISSSSTINLTAVSANSKVFGDQYISGKVDVADIKGFASESPKMGAAILTHVLTEYVAAQGMPGGQVLANFSAAHKAALGAESQIFGATTRTNTGSAYFPNPGSTISFQYRNGSGKIIQSFTYTLDASRTPH